MTLPITANTTCDIYHTPNAPPGAPDVAAVPIYLKTDWRRGQEAGERGNAAVTWTHVILMDSQVDIRDLYIGGNSNVPRQDIVAIPDGNGTAFFVIFVERVNRGTPTDHFRVYLDRQAAIWPTEIV